MGKQALYTKINARLQRAEVAVKNMAMIGMHDDRDSHQPGSEPAKASCLRGVSVDDVRFYPGQKFQELPESDCVCPGRNLPRHLRQAEHIALRVQEITHVLLAFGQAANHKMSFKLVRKLFMQEAG